MCVFACVCVRTRVRVWCLGEPVFYYVWLHVRVCVCACVGVILRVCVCVSMPVWACARGCVRVCSCVCVYAYVYIDMCICIYPTKVSRFPWYHKHRQRKNNKGENGRGNNVAISLPPYTTLHHAREIMNILFYRERFLPTLYITKKTKYLKCN